MELDWGLLQILTAGRWLMIKKFNPREGVQTKNRANNSNYQCFPCERKHSTRHVLSESSSFPLC